MAGVLGVSENLVKSVLGPNKRSNEHPNIDPSIPEIK
jgi:hypothetical protein